MKGSRYGRTVAPEVKDVGFTGTARKPLTKKQVMGLAEVLSMFPHARLHHGDAVHGDAKAFEMASSRGMQTCAHPPLNDKLRAHTDSTSTLDPKPYLARNRDIVNVSQLLIACPGSMSEQQRSGTWSTIRYARKLGRRIVIIFPNGDRVWRFGRG